MPAVRPDVAVLDVRLPDGDGISVCRDLRDLQPGLACLMLTSFADDEALFAAITAGAADYVLTQIRGSDLVDAVSTVGQVAGWSTRERRILELIGEGLTNRQRSAGASSADSPLSNAVLSEHLAPQWTVDKEAEQADVRNTSGTSPAVATALSRPSPRRRPAAMRPAPERIRSARPGWLRGEWASSGRDGFQRCAEALGGLVRDALQLWPTGQAHHDLRVQRLHQGAVAVAAYDDVAGH